MARYLLGVDLGTTKIKAGAFDLNGDLRALSIANYPTYSNGGPGWAEQSPEAWWRAAAQVLSEVAGQLDGASIAALCVGGQGPTLVAVDANGQPTTHAILWKDTRATEEQRLLSEKLGEPISNYSYLPNALWLKNHRKEIFEATSHLLSAWDFLALRLTGVAVSSQFGSMAPFPALHLEVAGIDPSLAPPPILTGQPIAELTPEAAEATGLPTGVPVVAGVNDGWETLIGAGLTQIGRAVDTGGTAGGFALCWDGPLEAEGVHSGPGLVEGQSIIGGSMGSLGRSLDWFLETFESPNATYEDVIRQAAQIPAGADELLFLPYLAGERSPMWDPEARGVFIGLTQQHGRSHFARAVLEASAYAFRHVSDSVLQAGARIDPIRVTGGQAKSRIWNQIKADVNGIAVEVPSVTEAAILGSAMLAGVGVEIFSSIADCADELIKIEEVIVPDSGRQAHYDELYPVYRDLYPNLKTTFDRLSVIRREKILDPASSRATQSSGGKKP